MSDLQLFLEDSSQYEFLAPSVPVCDDQQERRWFAAFTSPQHEQSVVRHLDAYRVQSFLPTFETTHVWKNRQKKRIIQPLFPSYVFVLISGQERRIVFRTPGILRLVGASRGPIPIPSADIDLLRSEAFRNRLEPYRDVLVGDRVRIRCGPMQGVEGTLVRKKNSLRFVLSISLINQHAALEVSADDVEPIRISTQ